MRRLLGASPPPNPDRYTRVLCEAFEGTGWLLSGGDMYVVNGMSPVCTSCDSPNHPRSTRDGHTEADRQRC